MDWRLFAFSFKVMRQDVCKQNQIFQENWSVLLAPFRNHLDAIGPALSQPQLLLGHKSARWYPQKLRTSWNPPSRNQKQGGTKDPFRNPLKFNQLQGSRASHQVTNGTRHHFNGRLDSSIRGAQQPTPGAHHVAHAEHQVPRSRGSRGSRP